MLEARVAEVSAASIGPAGGDVLSGLAVVPVEDVAGAATATLLASRALLGVVAVSLAPVLDRVSLQQFRALVLLSALGPVRIGALAERLGVHQSTLTRTVARLTRAGLADRAKNPSNRRQVMVTPTDAGLDLVRTVTEHRYRLLVGLLAGLPAEDRATVQSGMVAFARAAGEPSVDVVAFLGG